MQSASSAPRLLAAAALAALLLTGCHSKSKPAATAEPPPLTDAPIPASAPGASPAVDTPVTDAPRQATSQELAQMINADHTFTYSGIPFGLSAVSKAMSCQPTGQVAYTCSFAYTDTAHGGGQADLKVLIFDRPANLEDLKANLRSAVRGEPGSAKIQQSPSIKSTLNGANTVLPGECDQSQGQPNGLARCAFLIDPRVIVLTIVGPEKPFQSEGDKVGADIDRAESLAITAYSILQANRVSTAGASAPAPLPAVTPTPGAAGLGRTPVPPDLKMRIEKITASHAAGGAN